MPPTRELVALVESIRQRADCVVHEPRGPADLESGVAVPDDLVAFYELCGGMELRREQSPAWRVVPPNELLPAARRLLAPEDAEQVLAHVGYRPASRMDALLEEL